MKRVEDQTRPFLDDEGHEISTRTALHLVVSRQWKHSAVSTATLMLVAVSLIPPHYWSLAFEVVKKAIP